MNLARGFCERCGGLMASRSDEFGLYRSCYMCGASTDVGLPSRHKFRVVREVWNGDSCWQVFDETQGEAVLHGYASRTAAELAALELGELTFS